MVLDTNNNTATRKTLEKVSKVVNLDTDHIAISLAEFPLGGWTNPHTDQNTSYS